MSHYELTQKIKLWAKELGFIGVGITDTNLGEDTAYFRSWIKNGYHGEMQYLERHENLRFNPDLLMPNTKSVICCLMQYPPDSVDIPIASYAHGRDYHKIMRKKLLELAKKISEVVNCDYRVFCDSAPVLEKSLAAKSGLGWIGKNCLLINSKIGSYTFLGEIYIDLSLETDQEVLNRCGNCSRCLNSCPTKALFTPYQIDARRCISYLTIEYRGIIPEGLRSLIGNKIFGCDACQKCCPWNRFAKLEIKKHFTDLSLAELFLWNEEKFLKATEGTVLRRLGYECWLRNIAVALGNSPKTTENIAALKARENYPRELVREHVKWAQQNKV